MRISLCRNVHNKFFRDNLLIFCIVAPPEITILEKSTSFSSVIEYTVVGYPKPTLTWYHNSKPLDITAKAIRDNREQKFIKNKVVGHLEFLRLNLQYNGMYKVVATNKLGNATKEKDVIFLNYPGKSSLSLLSCS